MCGFTGTISLQQVDNEKIKVANKLIECRGPDHTSSVQKLVGKKYFNLWFNRLSIIDLDEKANQPMYSDKFKTTILFNGEIYNHQALRKELIKKGISFKTSHSDTETLLMGISFYGLSFIEKLRGQFAIAFLDELNNKFYLIRDRLGQKPLYLNFNNRRVDFGSNLISLLKVSSNTSLDEQEIYNYLAYGINNSPKTLYKSITKVKPGEIVSIDLSENQFSISQFNYWNIEDYQDEKNFNEEEFFDIFSESVKLRMEADVPVSNFLSGGIDSTSVVKNMLNKGQAVNSFSVYIDNPKYDESEFIKQVVRKYDLNHEYVKINSEINNKDIFESLDCLDEPFYDPSIIPSYLLSREISKKYKVAISGDGGDELLGGYQRTISSLNRTSLFKNLFSKFYLLYPAALGTGNKLLLNSNNLEKRFRSFLEDQKLLNIFGIKADQYKYASHLSFNNNNIYKSLLIADYKFYLPEMMMFKVDRTSMANSLEIRSPFVDNKLIEYVISTSTNYIDFENPKKILKNYLREDFNDKFLNRKKQGFVFDVENWVYNNLDLISDTISSGNVVDNLDKNIISKLKINKSRINGQRIWKLFVLENYLQRNS